MCEVYPDHSRFGSTAKFTKNGETLGSIKALTFITNGASMNQLFRRSFLIIIIIII
jgi:hypothetical protein